MLPASIVPDQFSSVQFNSPTMLRISQLRKNVFRKLKQIQTMRNKMLFESDVNTETGVAASADDGGELINKTNIEIRINL